MIRLFFFLLFMALTGLSSASTPGVRPGASGYGFFVVGQKLYDPAGIQFDINGPNRIHWDSFGSRVGIANTGSNVERIAFNFTKSEVSNFAIVTNEMLANKIVPMPGNWLGTCQSDPSYLVSIVDTWVAQAATWTQLNRNGLINIANEWGPSNSIVWRDSYITAVQRMRAAGYSGPLVIDAGGCGQDAQDIIKYGAAVLAADPCANIIFDVHVYSSFHYPATASWMQDYSKAMAGLKATGLAILIGEFGPATYTDAAGVVHKIGPSPTEVPTAVIIADAKANGFVGYLAWAWDDNNLPYCKSNDAWFSMTVNCGTYTGLDTDLTTFGKLMVPYFNTAVKATAGF